MLKWHGAKPKRTVPQNPSGVACHILQHDYQFTLPDKRKLKGPKAAWLFGCNPGIDAPMQLGLNQGLLPDPQTTSFKHKPNYTPQHRACQEASVRGFGGEQRAFAEEEQARCKGVSSKRRHVGERKS